MKPGPETNRRVATDLDDRAVRDRVSADRADRADVERLDAASLRAIAPEDIQILAATGC